MTDHPAKFSASEKPGVGAAIRVLDIYAAELDDKADAAVLPSILNANRLDADAVREAIDRLRRHL